MDTNILDNSASIAAATTQLERLATHAGFSLSETDGRISFTGADPVVPSRYRTGAAAAAAMAAQAAGVAAIWRMRSGRGQDVSVNLNRAVVPGLMTSNYVWQNGHLIERHPRAPASERVSFFATGDGRRHYLLRTTAYPIMMVRLSSVLKCAFNAQAIAEACLKWKSGLEFEDAVAEAKAVGAMARTREEWAAHPQGKWLATQGPVQVDQVGQSPAEPFTPNAARPLSGLRVLDIAHVLAGPSTGRLLAEQGADVLHVNAPWQLDLMAQVMDTSVGKRQANIDLEKPEDCERLRALIRETDVFVHSWRPGALEKFGFGMEDVVKLRPGIVYVSISCYGSGGPWVQRGGYEPIGQTLAGLAIAEGSPDAPKLAPTGTLNDYLTPSLAATGVMGALIRRAKVGGSYHVKASLTRSSMFVLETGPLNPDELARTPAGVPDARPEHLVEIDSRSFGRMKIAGPVTEYSETRAYWDRGAEFPGSSDPVWLPR